MLSYISSVFSNLIWSRDTPSINTVIKENKNEDVQQKKVAETVKVLKKFDVDKLKELNGCVTIIGRRKSGKTTLVKDLCKVIGEKDTTYVFNADEQSRREYDDIGKTFDCDRTTLNNTLTPPEKLYQKGKLLVFDNIESFLSNDPNSIKTVRDLVIHGRYMGTTSIVTQQYVHYPFNIARNVDYAFIFREDDVNYIKTLWEKYAYHHLTFENFKSIIEEVCTDFTCVVIDRVSSSENPQDRIFWYKAECALPQVAAKSE